MIAEETDRFMALEDTIDCSRIRVPDGLEEDRKSIAMSRGENLDPIHLKGSV